jgi:hypothetical protein
MNDGDEATIVVDYPDNPSTELKRHPLYAREG